MLISHSRSLLRNIQRIHFHLLLDNLFFYKFPLSNQIVIPSSHSPKKTFLSVQLRRLPLYDFICRHMNYPLLPSNRRPFLLIKRDFVMSLELHHPTPSTESVLKNTAQCKLSSPWNYYYMSLPPNGNKCRIAHRPASQQIVLLKFSPRPALKRKLPVTYFGQDC